MNMVWIVAVVCLVVGFIVGYIWAVWQIWR